MTIEEMRDALGNYCDSVPDCEVCKCKANEDGQCYSGPEELVIANYVRVFGAAPAPSDPDNVNHPAHYETGKYECIDVMVEALGEETTKGFCLGNAFKYIYRCKKKHDAPLDDVQKALWYLKKFLELEGVYHD